IRSFDQITKYLDCGVGRVILGTVAVKDFAFAESAVARFGESVAVGVDALNGKIAVNGWEEVTDIDAVEFCKKLKNIGVSNVIYTDISKDGMLSGTNLGIYKVLCQTEYPKITASGGISDIKELGILKNTGADGAILGKALYENKIDLKRAIKLAED
ncbi:MAG: 1-(5-phosphoribosyl)-5-((5-phosphoribosylamino)methylideneamino)imidazole-4-carboxamide isomerase, partial [Clostridia bacterium]|nr:1-(5-phosphoribosyl)-5-((5-phosphoribosylamino)methylideneamino)imidazole-4-carboxamide isomerase [Clostridia bacterium]